MGSTWWIKVWYYQYRIKGVKNPLIKKIGSFPTVGVTEAFNRAKKLSKDIYEGVDPRQTEKIEVLKEQLGQSIKRYYKEELTEVNQYRPSSIKMVKAIFGPWIFRNTYTKDILNRLDRAEDIQYKKLSMITNKMVMEFYRVVGARSPIVANRLIEYLRLFWNDFVKADNNPFIVDSKKRVFIIYYLDKILGV